MSDIEILELYFQLTEDEREILSKFITVRTEVDINPEYAKTLVNQIEGCRACGTLYDQIMRNKNE